MGNRVALVLVVVAVAVLGAAWYAAGTPARTATSDLPAEVAVSATEAGSGTWVRYLITIKNAGDTDFEGDAVLLNRAAPDVAAPTASPSAPPVPKVPTSIPRFPTTAPDAAYQFHFQVAKRQLRTLTIVAPDRYTTVAVAQTSDGAVVASADVDRSAYIPIAVLTGSQTVLDQLQGVRFDDLVLRVTDYSEARTVPTTALGFAPYVAVVIDGFDASTLSQAQRAALRDYVGQGGALITATGADWRRTLAALPQELVPFTASGTGTGDVGPVLALEGRGSSGTAELATGTPAAAAHVVLAGADGRPLVVQSAYGQGESVALTFDPRTAPANSQLAAAAWSEAIGRVLFSTAALAPATASVPGVDASTALAFPSLRPAALPSPWLVGPLLLLYLILVAPVNYLVLRRRLRNPNLLWVTAPLIAALFTGAFYWLGTILQGDLTDEQLQILKLGPNSSVAELEYHRIVFLHRGDHVLQTVQPALAAPLTYDLSNVSATSCGQLCDVELSGLRSGEEHVVPALRPLVLEHGVVYGGVRILGTASVSHLPVGVDAHLQWTAGHVTGELMNRGDRPVHGIVLYTNAGGAYRRTALASLVAPHSTVRVDGTPQPWDGDPNSPVPGTRAAPDPATRLSRAVGLAALERSSSSWLVGFTDPVSGSLAVDGSVPRQNAITVFEAPAAIDEADGEVSDFAARRLAATTGDRSHGGLTDVYDLELPWRLPSGLTVSYDKFQYSQVDVYDWTAGTWKQLPWVDQPTNQGRLSAALASSEVLRGATGGPAVIRLRVREARLSWGANLYVAGSS